METDYFPFGRTENRLCHCLGGSPGKPMDFFQAACLIKTNTISPVKPPRRAEPAKISKGPLLQIPPEAI